MSLSSSSHHGDRKAGEPRLGSAPGQACAMGGGRNEQAAIRLTHVAWAQGAAVGLICGVALSTIALRATGTMPSLAEILPDADSTASLRTVRAARVTERRSAGRRGGWPPASPADVGASPRDQDVDVVAELTLAMLNGTGSTGGGNRHKDPAPAAETDNFKYAFYLHVFGNPDAVIHQTEVLRRYYPRNPVTIMSDGGWDFSRLCVEHNCTFVHCPPANDRWHPWPFLHRIRDAAIRMNAEYTVYLEPDNSIHGPITHEPEFDAGGMLDSNPRFSYGIVTFVAAQARKLPGRENFTWSGFQGSGLAGGSYFRTAAIADAFSDDNVMAINWAHLFPMDSKRLHSSDFAMPIALSYRGYSYGPWKDIVQKDLPNQPNVSSYAFEHYGRGVVGGKPEYNVRLDKASVAKLVSPIPAEFRNKGTCSFCWDPAAYVEAWGTESAGRCANLLPVRCYGKSILAGDPSIPPEFLIKGAKPCHVTPQECRGVPLNRKLMKRGDACREMHLNGTLPWHGLCIDGSRPPVFFCPTAEQCVGDVKKCDVWDPLNKSQVALAAAPKAK